MAGAACPLVKINLRVWWGKYCTYTLDTVNIFKFCRTTLKSKYSVKEYPINDKLSGNMRCTVKTVVVFTAQYYKYEQLLTELQLDWIVLVISHHQQHFPVQFIIETKRAET